AVYRSSAASALDYIRSLREVKPAAPAVEKHNDAAVAPIEDRLRVCLNRPAQPANNGNADNYDELEMDVLGSASGIAPRLANKPAAQHELPAAPIANDQSPRVLAWHGANQILREPNG